MKRIFTLMTFVLLTSLAYSQDVIDFEDVALDSNSFWDGSDQSGGFYSSNIFFPNSFNDTYSFWASGWAASNVEDSITSGFGNLFAAKPGAGARGSATYALGQQGSKLTFPPFNFIPDTLWITNSTYAHNSMRDGDTFAKKFGGETGDDPDYFLLTITLFESGGVEQTIEFYLADYRFEDNSQDYIVKDWVPVVLDGGVVDSIQFNLSSTDIGDYGINTPLFFCIDNFAYQIPVSTREIVWEENLFEVYPNPVREQFQIQFNELMEGQLRLLGPTGQLLLEKPVQSTLEEFSVSTYPSGMYFLLWTDGNRWSRQKIIIAK